MGQPSITLGIFHCHGNNNDNDNDCNASDSNNNDHHISCNNTVENGDARPFIMTATMDSN
jgi:hypothetical protein